MGGFVKILRTFDGKYLMISLSGNAVVSATRTPPQHPHLRHNWSKKKHFKITFQEKGSVISVHACLEKPVGFVWGHRQLAMSVCSFQQKGASCTQLKGTAFQTSQVVSQAQETRLQMNGHKVEYLFNRIIGFYKRPQKISWSNLLWEKKPGTLFYHILRTPSDEASSTTPVLPVKKKNLSYSEMKPLMGFGKSKYICNRHKHAGKQQ